MRATKTSPEQPPGRPGRQVAPEVQAAVDAAVRRHEGEPGPLLLVLSSLAESWGYVPAEAIAPVAHALNLSRAEVHGVLSFYTDLHTEPRGEHLVQLCRAEACQSVGARDLVQRVTDTLGVELGGSDPQGLFTLEGVFCLGNCALGPAAAIDGKLRGRVDADRLLAEIAGWAGGHSGEGSGV